MSMRSCIRSRSSRQVASSRRQDCAELQRVRSGSPVRCATSSVRSDLAFNDGGTLGVTGKLDLASRNMGYDVDIVANLFNANAIIAKAPRTSITATASANGRGTDPATMTANVVADVQSSTYDTLSVTSAKIRLAAANGMARVDTLAVEIPQGVANASGTFGLARGKSGQLTYHVSVDSLNRLSSLLPPADTGVVLPRPGILASRIARARADSAREAKATEVERAALGKPPVTLAAVDTPKVVSKSQLSGSLIADGVATGNIHDFGLKGTASGANIVARGNTIARFNAQYDWTNALTPQSHVDITADASRVNASGFDLDSVHTRVAYTKPQGTAEITVVQNATDVYSLNADYLLNKTRNELRLNRMQLRFDSTVWASTRASTLHWGEAGVDIDKLELRNQSTGRIYVDGLIPKNGRANVEVAVDNFAVEDLISLAQSNIPAKGLVSFDIKAQGTAEDPTFSGSFGTQNFLYQRHSGSGSSRHAELRESDAHRTSRRNARGRAVVPARSGNDSDQSRLQRCDGIANPERPPNRSRDQGRQSSARSRSTDQHVRHQPEGPRDGRLQGQRHAQPPGSHRTLHTRRRTGSSREARSRSHEDRRVDSHAARHRRDRFTGRVQQRQDLGHRWTWNWLASHTFVRPEAVRE